MKNAEMLNTVVLGGGPGGIGLLLAARRGDHLARLMAGGFAMVERGPSIGAGLLGNHVITSDSTAETFLDCLRGNTHPALAELQTSEAAQAVARHAGGAVPLALAGRLLCRIGAVLAEQVTAYGGAVLTGHSATGLARRPDGSWAVTVRAGDASQPTRVLRARNVVLSLGAEQPVARLHSETVAGSPLLPRYADRVVQSGELFTPAGVADLSRRLRGSRQPLVAVIGGSTSAAAAANLLLHGLPEIGFGPGGVVLMHRRALRICYDSAAAALADGYTEFGPQDICPLTRRVYRLAGFRLDSRALILAARGIGGRKPDPRLRLHRLDEAAAAASERILDQADVIIAALGYRPRTLPVHAADGSRIDLRGDSAVMLPLVDAHCRVADAAGCPIPGLFGLGLATGFVPSGRLGGEASFVGQANGLWLWQNDVGGIILDQVLAGATPRPQQLQAASAARAA